MADQIIKGDVDFQMLDGTKVLSFQPAHQHLQLVNPEGTKVLAWLTPTEFMAGSVKVGGVGTYVHAFNNDGVAKIGGAGKGGTLILRSDSEERFRLDANSGYCLIGGNGAHGQIMLFATTTKAPNASGQATIHLQAGDATIRAGVTGHNGQIKVFNDKGKNTILIHGGTGDISFENADCAEEFDVDDRDIEPGSVLVMSDESGRLRLSDSPYDTRVAGVLSGGGSYRPAMVLDRKVGREDRRPVALVGKVWCKVEAKSAPVTVGSLLTTSSLPGHAMAVTDRERAFGAVLGKALAPMTSGVGVVPVLVGLQ